LITDASIPIGSANVPPGRYCLFTTPGKDKWTLVISKEPDLFGRVGYNRKRDLARVDMELKDTAEHIEQFTIRINQKSELDGLLEMAFGNVLVNVAVATKPPVTPPR
jgi:hypothetical protein